mgnify:CR=1 FL=1
MRIEILTYILTYTLIGCAIIAMLLIPIELAQDYIHRYRNYKHKRKEIELNIQIWTSIAKSCDPIADAYDKGYAIARLVIYHHELDELDRERKEYLCS